MSKSDEPPTASSGESGTAGLTSAVLGVPRMVQLDGLRTLAVADVACSHWAREQTQGLPLGTGVQLFFVLSGYLITGILLDNKQASPRENWTVWKRFYIRRSLRIFPLYYLVLFLCYGLSVANMRETWPWHASYLSNFYFFLQKGWSDASSLKHFWSLGVEEQFYLLWPFVVLVLTPRHLFTLLKFLILAAPLFRFGLTLVIPDNPLAKVLPPGCLDALGGGGLIALLQRHPSFISTSLDTLVRRLLGAGALMAGAGFALRFKGHDSAFSNSIGHTGLVFFYIWAVHRASFGFSGWTGRFLSFKPMVYFGSISYGIYVFHNIVPWVLTHYAGQKVLPFPLNVLTYLALTLLLAMVSWHLFEAPINRLKSKFPYR